MAKSKSIDIRKLRRGDKETFKRLFETFFVPLREFAVTYVGQIDIASDIVQEAFVKFWTYDGDFEDIYKVKSFLYSIVRNASINELAHRQVVNNYAFRIVEESQNELHTFDTELVELRSEVFRALRAEIAALPKRTRQVMELVLKGEHNDEIASQLGVGYETVHTLKRIAVKRLRSRMEQHKDNYNEIIS